MLPVSLLVRKLRWKVWCHGIEALPLACGFKLYRTLARRGDEWYANFLNDHFDRRFRVDTNGIIATAQLYDDPERQKNRGGYQASSPVELGWILSRLPIDHRRYRFVDLGSGKGRTLIVASRLPFKSVVGVEANEQLNEIARQNLEKMRQRGFRCKDLGSVCDDATTFEFPVDPTVVFLFNPFKEAVMASVLEQVKKSHLKHPRHLVFVYHNPRHQDLMDASGFLKPLGMTNIDETDWAIYETGDRITAQAGQAASLPA